MGLVKFKTKLLKLSPTLNAKIYFFCVEEIKQTIYALIRNSVHYFQPLDFFKKSKTTYQLIYIDTNLFK